jgi:hypothetical protein
MTQSEIITELDTIIKDLIKQNSECNQYLRANNDVGKTHRKDDPLETISFTRGKSIGLLTGLSKIETLKAKLT